MLTSRVVRKVFVNVPSVITGPKRVKVGFPVGEADADNIQKAIWNEFGTRGGASGGGWGGRFRNVLSCATLCGPTVLHTYLR